MDEDSADLAPQYQRDNAILQVQIQDARLDIWQWREIARSNEEVFYLDEMDECLGDLVRIVEARSATFDPNNEERNWQTLVDSVLDAYERVKNLRGRTYGAQLSSLVWLRGDGR